MAVQVDAGEPTSIEEPSDPLADLEPQQLESITRIANERAEAFHALVASVLEEEQEFLDGSIETLLTQNAVLIDMPQGVVRATVINPGTDGAEVKAEHWSSTGAWGNSLIPISEIPVRDLKQRLRFHLAACIANLRRGPART